MNDSRSPWTSSGGPVSDGGARQIGSGLRVTLEPIPDEALIRWNAGLILIFAIMLIITRARQFLTLGR
jgi:hypothetical protein